MYITIPSHSWWERKNYVDAQTMPDDFVYTSDRNSEWLGVEQLRTIVFGKQEESTEPVRQMAHV